MQNEAAQAIKELTVQMMYVGGGVFALVGGYLSSQDHQQLNGRRCLVFALGAFGLSLGCGLVVLMRLIGMLQANNFDANDQAMRLCSVGQLLAVGVGALLFFFYLCQNLWSKK